MTYPHFITATRPPKYNDETVDAESGLPTSQAEPDEIYRGDALIQEEHHRVVAEETGKTTLAIVPFISLPPDADVEFQRDDMIVFETRRGVVEEGTKSTSWLHKRYKVRWLQE